MNARITKNELIAINSKLAAENAALRAQISELSVQRAASGGREQSAECKVHNYASFKEAKDNMLRLIAWDTDKRFTFTQRGDKVICKLRATH